MTSLRKAAYFAPQIVGFSAATLAFTVLDHIQVSSWLHIPMTVLTIGASIPAFITTIVKSFNLLDDGWPLEAAPCRGCANLERQVAKLRSDNEALVSGLVDGRTP